MTVRAVCFTENGKNIIKRIASSMENVCCYAKYSKAVSENDIIYIEKSIEEWAGDAFEQKEAIIFAGAMGIAIRAIASYVKDKLTDSPVIVVDDNGQFVIPVLSGHVGGANELAHKIANILNGIPVITTSTDNSDAFAVDLFAKENNLRIINRDGIKRVSSKAIEGKCITMSIKDYPPPEYVDVLVSDEDTYPGGIRLAPKEYVVGVGLKRGMPAKQIETAILEVLGIAGITVNEVGALATIDIKLDEEGLKGVSRKYHLPLIGYECSILQRAEGEFSASEFVKETVGVDNVCERAAVIATNQGRLVVRKFAKDGVTAAVAVRRKRNG